MIGVITMNIHGSMKFSWTNSLLYVQGTGPFNEEGMKEGSANYVNAILTKQFTNFSVIKYGMMNTLALQKSWRL